MVTRDHCHARVENAKGAKKHERHERARKARKGAKGRERHEKNAKGTKKRERREKARKKRGVVRRDWIPCQKRVEFRLSLLKLCYTALVQKKRLFRLKPVFLPEKMVHL